MQIDGIEITKDQHSEIQRLAALGHPAEDIALYIGLKPEERILFARFAEQAGTETFELIREGILVSRATPEIKLHEAAENGNLDAIKQLAEVNKWRRFENLLKDLDYNEQ